MKSRIVLWVADVHYEIQVTGIRFFTVYDQTTSIWYVYENAVYLAHGRVRMNEIE